VLDQGTTPDRGGDYVEFWTAGSEANGEFTCTDCGYGVSVQAKLPRCPMCAGEAWEQRETSPFSWML
jgi:hypothetical protein